ncbi:Permease of the drug/metabolite transporter (DMT) superfamily [Terribacillus aidingensis]|uniref:Permease of the drug/metabolite transporter (DMT) superfamily n=1 Tax=Terribacillus aidingensis TaxID=586416 RepID=A0A285NYV5_9BACI|nr:DMT family transporter [Terribacillus aidingensis]SNZ14672.1 Permease of the drug/metabolite transporter (DMT) superfamily [Terribacillus aidingensis]
MQSNRVAILLFISIIAISFAAIFVKWSYAPATILSMNRMYLACLFLLPVVWMNRREFKKIDGKEAVFFVLAGACLAAHFALWFSSLKLTTVASSTIILSLQPIVAMAGGFLLYKERASKTVVVTICISIIGVVMVGWGDFGLQSSTVLIGDLLSFCSVIAVVAYLLIGQNNVKKVSHWIYSFCVFLSAAVWLNIYNLAAGVPIRGYNFDEWKIFILLAIFPTIAHVIFNLLLNYVNTTVISMSVLGEPVGATLLAVWLLGEKLTWLQLTGGAIALIGVLLFLIRQNSEYDVMKDETESRAE